MSVRFVTSVSSTYRSQLLIHLEGWIATGADWEASIANHMRISLSGEIAWPAC